MLIYVYIQSRTGEDVRLREVQHAMGFASPSSALFHLQKLETAGLIVKDSVGSYKIKNRVRVQLVRNYVLIRRVLVPRHAFYASLMTVASVVYFELLQDFLHSPLAILALLLNAVPAGVFWFESWRDWKTRPKFSNA